MFSVDIGGLEQLRHLDLSGCNEITNLGLLILGDNLYRVQWLDLSGCDKITDNGWAELVDTLLTY